MKQYLDLLRHVMDHGIDKSDRTGVGTRSVFGYQTRYNLAEGFPLVTTKKVHLKSIIYELLWFLKGYTYIDYLKEHKVTIWDEWAEPDGYLGPIYGAQWIRWKAADGRKINQMEIAQKTIRENPDSRRILVSGWNVGELETLIKNKKSAPPPCHTLIQFYVVNNKLSCQLYQRSADSFLGVPFNIASYALLTMMMAQATGRELGDFVHTFGDLHIYKNHFEQVQLQLTREPHPLPHMKINPERKDIFSFEFEDFELVGYDPHPGIKAPIAI